MKIRTDNIGILSEGFDRLAPPAWAGPGPHYVLATEGDCGLPRYTCNKYGQPVKRYADFMDRDPEPIVQETCLHKASTLEQVRERAERLGNYYGQRAIYRLELVEVLP